MRSLLSIAGLILAATAHAQEAPPAPADAEAGALELPTLPPSLADAAQRDHRGDAVEGRSITDAAMARALGAAVLSDWDLALVHAERAAAGGEPLGATLAGHILLQGLSSRGGDDDAAVRWLRRAGEQGEPDALIILSRLATTGRGGLEPFQARGFLAQAAEGGDERAAHEYGLYLMLEGDPGAAPQAVDWLRLAAESGRTEAYADYAEALGEWVHGPNDLGAARLWYERAAEAGDGLSAAIAATMYLSGEGGAADPARGVQLMRRGAELGTPSAMGSYALLLFQGAPSLPADPVRAADWARQGAQAGDGESQFLYAYALATGDGAAQDFQRAYYWVRRAGAPRRTGLADDADRAQLESALERVLPEPAVLRLRAEAAAQASGL
jgi:TPR repeat protein